MTMAALLAASPSREIMAATAPGCAETWPIIAGLLALAFLVGIAVAVHLARSRSVLRRAQAELLTLTLAVEAREEGNWRDTGVSEVDTIARTIAKFEERLREKRQRLAELNDLLVKKSTVVSPGGVNIQLRAILDAMPVGILIAEAPSGRIVEGNHAIELMLRHPIRYSENIAEYNEWKAVHQDGRPVASDEYPLARALAGEDHPTLECKYSRGDGGDVWINIVGAPIRDEQGAVIGGIVAVTDIDAIKAAETHKRMMNLELHHRVNNSLAMIQGIANITARSATDFGSFRSDFSDRVQCLSRISTLLVQTSWERTPLRDLIMVALVCDGDDYSARISLSGEDVELRSGVALALGVALFELRSNAEQHGALSNAQGGVAISWRIDHEKDRPCLILDWVETGGPKIENPQRPGVGIFLIKNVLSRQMGGDVELSFIAEGLQATLCAEI